MALRYWPEEDPVYDQSKSRAENYLYLRGLFETEASEEKNINISPAKYYKSLLTHRQFKGAHTEINYTESLRDLIESGVVKVPIMDFDVIFVEWASGYLDETDLIYKATKAMFDFGYSGRDSEQGLEFGGDKWWDLRDKAARSHEYKNFPEEKFVPSPVVKQNQIRLTANFNYRPILAKYDVAAVNKSAIKYFDAVLSVTDELLNVLQEYETSQSETIAEFLKITLNLGAKYTDNPNLTEEENSLLSERQKILARRLEIGIDAPKRRILSVKAQAERFFERLDAINDGTESISELAELQAQPRADFELLVENMARIIRDVQQRVDFLDAHREFVSNVVKAHIGWSNDYKAFKTSLREELAADCRNDGIDDEIFAAWYDDWQKKRLAIEQRFLPLVEFGFKGALSETVDDLMGVFCDFRLKRPLSEEVYKVLRFLGEYRGAVDKFYLHERKNIYQKFAFVPGGDLQEKFETESELYKLAEKLQRDLQGIIFACDKTEERIFLLRWSEPILNLPIDEISNFIRDKELDSIAEEVLTQFAELKRKNFAEYLADSKAYSDAAQNREKEFNALIFRMRKDLNKQ